MPGIFTASRSVEVLLRGKNGPTIAVLLWRAVVVCALTPIPAYRPFPRLGFLRRAPCFLQLLRNISPNEWVTEVEKMYPGDDEVKGMLGKVGKLMNMMDYYEDKKKK